MNKIVTITGHKNCKKELVVDDLIKNDGVGYIKPYTDWEIAPNLDESYIDMYNHVSSERLDKMIEKQDVLYSTTINGHRFFIFGIQMKNKVNVLYADDYGVIQIKDNWDNVFTVRIVSDKEIKSDRVGEYLFDHEFDCIFDYDKDNIEDLEEMIL